MYILIGKEFSKPTIEVRAYLDQHHIVYTYVDIDMDDEGEMWLNWLKLNRILALPVLKNASHFTVGDDLRAIDALIFKK